jgi:cytochrome c peroxidase
MNKQVAKAIALAVLCASAGLVAARAQQAISPAAFRPELPLGLDLYMPVPEDNPLTPERVALGRKLFRDPILSRDRSLACTGCHVPEHAFTDGRSVSVGVFGRTGERNVPALLNRSWGRSFFWDGRTKTIEEQVVQPVVNPVELDLTLEEAVARLAADAQYAQEFAAAFGREVNAEDLARALAGYVRTILAGDAPIDRYYAGHRDALSPAARRGLDLFRGKANCTACHLGPTFTDEQFHNTGIAWRDGSLRDLGRYLVTKNEFDRGAFKTPSLREVARTAPYMHDGSLATLEAVVDFYDRAGNRNPHIDPELRRLWLSEDEKKDLVEFLRSLSGTIQEGKLRAAASAAGNSASDARH